MAGEIKVLQFAEATTVTAPTAGPLEIGDAISESQAASNGQLLDQGYLLEFTTANDINNPSATSGSELGLRYFEFSYTQEQSVNAIVTVPPSYVDGSQISLAGGSFFTSEPTGDVLIRSQSTLLKAGSTDISSIFSGDTYESTNSEFALSTSNQLEDITELDLSDVSGEINSVAITAGDKILIRLFRKISSESSPAEDGVKLLTDLFRIKFKGA